MKTAERLEEEGQLSDSDTIESYFDELDDETAREEVERMPRGYMLSTTAEHCGFRADGAECATGLTRYEMDFARAGGRVYFRAPLSDGNYGTTWRYVEYCGESGFASRVPEPYVIIMLDVTESDCE